MLGKLIKALLWTIAILISMAIGLYLDAKSESGRWIFMLIVTGAGALIGAWKAWRRQQLYLQTPTTDVSESSSGRVELLGRAAAPDGQLLRDPVEDEACVWFAVKSFRGSWPNETIAAPSIGWLGTGKSSSIVIKSAMSSRPFVLHDKSGRCLVDPAGAEFDLNPDSVIVDKAADVTHLVWRITEGQPLTILGHFQPSDGDKYSGEVSKPNGSPYLISYRAPAQLARG